MRKKKIAETPADPDIDQTGEDRAPSAGGPRATTSEAYLKQAQRIAQLGHWRWSNDKLCLTEWSEQHAAIIGVAHDELDPSQEGIYAPIHPDDRDRVIKSYRDANARRTGFDLSYRIVRPDGEVRYVREIAEPEFDDGGRLADEFGTMQDITDLKLAEQALREREVMLNQAQRIAQLSHWRWSPDTRSMTEWSEQFAIIMGVAPDEFDPHIDAFVRQIHPDDRERVVKGYRDSNTQRAVYDQSFRIVRPSGEIRYLREVGEPQFDDSGRLVQEFGMLQDITDLKLVEQALRESEEQFRSLIEDSIQGVLIYRDIEPVFANQALADIFGYQSPEEIIELGSMIPMVAEEERERLGLTGQPRAENVYVPAQYEFQGLRKDGSRIWLENRGNVVKWGGETAILSIVVDITNRVRTEEQLRHAQRMEAVGRLTAGVAHDFNNLLAVIMGNSEIVRDRLGNNDPAVRAITGAARRGSELTQRLLAFSRQQPLRPSTANLATLTREMAGILSRTLGETIAIEVKTPRRPWLARVDTGELENAILNLALNARDTMPGGGALTIETANVTLTAKQAAEIDDAAPGKYVRLSLTDTGQGMPAEVMEHAFEPFFTTKEFGENSGLGLSMVYGFVTQSGGFVTIESREGEGATVSLYLPRAETKDEPDPESRTPCQPMGQGGTILVVEDDPDVRKLTVILLSAMGYTVLEAEDSEGAMTIITSARHIDLLLSDVVLPGDMSGPAIAEEALIKRPKLRVMFMSGYAGDVIRRDREGGEHTIDADLLAKPFTRAQLAKKVRAALGADQE